MSEYNSTFRKFNGPSTLIHAYDYWSVLARPKQVTIGSLVLVANSEATAFSDLPATAFAELETVIGHIESTLSDLFSYQKINYLMLMMVDPHVHFHVIPRYKAPCTFESWTLEDEGWPGQPVLSSGSADSELVGSLRDALADAWPASAR